MEIADRPERLRGSLHCVAANRAVHMKIDKTGREIISIKIDNVLCRRPGLLPDLHNFPFVRDDLEAFPDPIRKNQSCVAENHFGEVRLVELTKCYRN